MIASWKSFMNVVNVVAQSRMVARTSFHLVLTVLILQKQSKKVLQSHYIAALL